MPHAAKAVTNISMKWVLVLAIVGAYLTGVRWLSRLALRQIRQVESTYQRVITYPDSYANL